ncbi:hypothetical protein EYV94_13840 [Puteibacter caeruleilacunae]|nr:hypothetical protein EYV94_13840 [Puteibacter caeruleilacunae]
MNRGIGILVGLLFSIVYSVSAQYYETGQDPASVKWKQINTLNFQIIYPNKFEQKAKYLANVLREVYLRAGETLEHEPGKISVILHNQTVRSNGLVAWAPKRMELFTTPHQGIYAQDWLEQLAIHEFRHVVQIDKINQELPGILKALLGQHAAALTIGAYVPFWFLEGDAVATETALTNSGRGRLPKFLMETNAQLAEKGLYSYYKAYLGSYKDFVPDHYKMGYNMVAGTRAKYGKDVWADVLNHVGNKPFDLWGFDRALKKKTGKRKVDLYKEIYNDLEKQALEATRGIENNNTKRLTAGGNVYTSFRYPAYIDDNIVLAQRSSLDALDEFVMIDKTKNIEIGILKPGIVFKESVSSRDNFIVWSERRPDARWTHRDRSVINVYNIDNKQLQQIKLNRKVYAPQLSPNLKQLCVVEVDERNIFRILIVDPITHEIINEFNTKENLFLMTPSWIDDNRLTAIALGEKGKAIVEINLNDQSLTQLTSFSFTEIAKPLQVDNNLYFIGTYDGKNDVYCLNRQNNELTKIYTSKYGVGGFNINKDGKKMVISAYSSDGYYLTELKLDNLKASVTQNAEYNYAIADKLSRQEGAPLDFSRVKDKPVGTQSYSKFGNSLYFHSWAPVFIDVDDMGIEPGIAFLSQNKLSNTDVILGYRYDTGVNTGKYYGKVVYKGWYPQFSLELEKGEGGVEGPFTVNYRDNQGNIVKTDTYKKLIWDETNIKFDVTLPLSFARHSWNQFIMPQVGIERVNFDYQNAIFKPLGGDVNILKYRLYFQNSQFKAYKDMYPNWGQIFDFTYKHTPFGDLQYGDIWGAQTVLYVPGLAKTHGIKLYGGIQEKEQAQGALDDVIRFPRGLSDRYNDFMYTLGADYKLPIAYPDWNIGKLAYFKRFKTSLFFDYSYMEANLVDVNSNPFYVEGSLKSYGAEISTDMHLFGFAAPIDLGVRFAYSPEEEDLKVGFMLLINFDSL